MDNLITEKIDEWFQIEDDLNKGILDELALYIYYLESLKSQSDLYLMAKILTKEDLYKLIDYYDGDTVHMPSKEELKRSYLLGVCFFLKKYIGLNWEQIHNFLDLPAKNEEVSAISLGRRLNQIEGELLASLKKTLSTIKPKDLKRLMKAVGETKND